MEQPNAKGASNFIVGLFVCMGLLVGTGFVFFMGGASLFSGEVKYQTFFKDVRGLNVGAAVYLSGIPIGRVSQFQFPKEKNAFVDSMNNGIIAVYSVSKEHRARIKKDCEATITTQGMLGDKVIVITPGSETAEALAPGGFIGAKTTGEISDMIQKSGSVVENLNEVTQNLNALIKNINESGRIPQILENLDRTMGSMATITGNLKNSNSTLGSLVNGGEKDDLGPALKSLRRILEKIDKGQGTLGALVNDSTLHEDMKILLGGAKRSQMVRFLLRQAISAGDDKEEKKEPVHK